MPAPAPNKNQPPDPARRVYASPLVWIGEFRCGAGHRLWTVENNTGERNLLVFPRTLVGIRQSGREPVLCDPTCAMLYNAWQPYERELVDPRGDQCEWFAIEPATVVEAALEFDPSVADRPQQPFSAAHGPSDPKCYLTQRRLYERARDHSDPEGIQVEETFFGLLRAVLRASVGNGRRARSVPIRRATQSAHRDLADRARRILGGEFTQPTTLDELAGRVFASPYHLCRVFRAQVGMPIHHYLTQLRLRASLDRLNDRRTDLTRLALDLGFSSHSHFSAAFREAYRITPARARVALSGPRISNQARN